jgi:hypothetical protein
MVWAGKSNLMWCFSHQLHLQPIYRIVFAHFGIIHKTWLWWVNAPDWVNHSDSVSEKLSSEKGLQAFNTRNSDESEQKIGYQQKKTESR